MGARYIRGYGLPDFVWWAKEHTKPEKPDPWYIRDGTWLKAKELGLMDGTRPTENITRAEVAAVAVRLYNRIKEGG